MALTYHIAYFKSTYKILLLQSLTDERSYALTQIQKI